MNILILFIVCTAVNVILSTIKSIATVNGGKFVASLMNAICYGFYSYVIILTNTDGISTIDKMIVTAACNFVGVYIVKWAEEKARKDKLWKVEMAVKTNVPDHVKSEIEARGIPCNYNLLGKWTIFNCYCDTKEQTAFVESLCSAMNGKISAYESKALTL